MQGDGLLRSCWVAGCGLLLGFRVFVFFGIRRWHGLGVPFSSLSQGVSRFSVGIPLILVV